jgi:hypothetical protein
VEKGRWASRLGRAGALVLIGALAGSVMLTPVGAHITTFNHLKNKHFYTKKAANARFVNTTEIETKAVTGTTVVTTSSTTFVDVPGAVTSLAIPTGTKGLIHANFSAESACYGPDPQNCSVRILINGIEANPASGSDFAFDTNRGGDNPGNQFTGEAHSMERYLTDLPAGAYEVKVQFLSVSGSNTTQLDDWILTVERVTTG